MATRGDDRLGTQHSGGGLLAGLHRTRPSAGGDLEPVAAHGGAVGILSLDKNKADGGRVTDKPSTASTYTPPAVHISG